MTPELPASLPMRSPDLLAGRLEALRELLPEAFAEGELSVEKLLSALGRGEGPEPFGLNWPGKREALRLAQSPSGGTLLPAPDESVNWEEAEHVFLEGDNLEVLKLLQAGYSGAFQLIVIDPPYNTGNDFVYPDDYRDGVEAYLRLSGQRGESGRLTSNAETDGRYHSRWLSMTAPRLFLARRLLAPGGFLFVTIDDHEVATLRLLLGELFGEENFVAHLVWQKKYTRSNDARFFSATHDHILVFARDRQAATLNHLPRTSAQTSAYSNPDGHPRGPWKATPLHARSGRAKGFTYTFANGRTWSPPPGTYPRYSRETLAELEAAGAIWYGADGQGTPVRKSFLADVKAGVTPVTIWPHEEVGHTHEANQELKALLGEGIFDTPKPTRLIRRMLELATPAEGKALVLDFFGGSGTTAQAVLEQNAEDGGDRRFVLVQWPEPVEGPFSTIAEIAKERVRRVMAKLDDPQLGMRVYKLADSCFKRWPGPGNLEERIVEAIEPLLPGADPLAVVHELLLKAGHLLTCRVEAIALGGQRFYAADDWLLSLEQPLSPAAVEAAIARRPRTLVLRQDALPGEAQWLNLSREARRVGTDLRVL